MVFIYFCSFSISYPLLPCHQYSKMAHVGRIDIDHPRYDQSTFIGRAKHFLITTNPLNVLATDAELDHAKSIVERYR